MFFSPHCLVYGQFQQQVTLTFAFTKTAHWLTSLHIRLKTEVILVLTAQNLTRVSPPPPVHKFISTSPTPILLHEISPSGRTTRRESSLQQHNMTVRKQQAMSCWIKCATLTQSRTRIRTYITILHALQNNTEEGEKQP